MEIVLTFKTPDVLDRVETEEAKAFIEQYIKWGEIISIAFNLDTKTVRVLKVGEGL